jgi:hypothetical protein
LIVLEHLGHQLYVHVLDVDLLTQISLSDIRKIEFIYLETVVEE